MSQSSLLEQLTRPRRALSVSELTEQIRTAIEGRFLDVWVAGEISNFKQHSSGHWYFTLKDEAAMIRCTSFRMQNRLIRFTPADGLSVRCRGRLTVYGPKGDYQLLVELVEPVGVGALQVALAQLREKLASEGMFDAARKRSLPLLPKRIGIVTSPDGAAVRDILRILKRRNEAVSILVAPVRVQGDNAAPEIAAAIQSLNRIPSVDVIIVARGGGSTEDLWCFNDESVARAIFRSRAPVISAVGHETDHTLADSVADMRASTPSAAAELVAAARDQISSTIQAFRERMTALVRYKIARLKGEMRAQQSRRGFHAAPRRIAALRQSFDDRLRRLEGAASRAIRKRGSRLAAVNSRLKDADVRRWLAEGSTKLTRLNSRAEAAWARRLARRRQELSVAASRLGSLSPLAVLHRGYAIAFDDRGHAIKRAADMSAGDKLRLRLEQGELGCTVNDVRSASDSGRVPVHDFEDDAAGRDSTRLSSANREPD